MAVEILSALERLSLRWPGDGYALSEIGQELRDVRPDIDLNQVVPTLASLVDAGQVKVVEVTSANMKIYDLDRGQL